MTRHHLAALDALAIFDQYETDGPCREALNAVVDSKPAGQPILLDCALTRLEFHEIVETDEHKRECYREAQACIELVLEVGEKVDGEQ